MNITLIPLGTLPSNKTINKSKTTECIIGVDPGLANIGIAALESENKLLMTAVLTTCPNDNYANRLTKIQQQLKNFLQRVGRRTSVVYYEENFNLDIKINITLGVILGTIGAEKMMGINPKRVKQTVYDNACADKQAIINFVNAKFNTRLRCPHQADAALIALAGLSGRWAKDDDAQRGTRIHRPKKTTNKPPTVATRKIGRPRTKSDNSA